MTRFLSRRLLRVSTCTLKILAGRGSHSVCRSVAAHEILLVLHAEHFEEVSWSIGIMLIPDNRNKDHFRNEGSLFLSLFLLLYGSMWQHFLAGPQIGF